MKITFPDPKALVARVAEFRELIASLHQLVGPGLRQFMDTHDMSFSAMNALIKYREKLLAGVVTIREVLMAISEEPKSSPQEETRA